MTVHKPQKDMSKLMGWVNVVKGQKLQWMEMHPKQPDMNPCVIVEREGKVRAVVIANRLDKNQGLHIAFLCRKGFAADALTLICDAHIAHGKPGEENKWKEPGSMQKACDEQGACKTREITDCMICTRICASDGKLQYVVLPYFYDEKYKGEFHWFDDEISDMDEHDPDVKLSGHIPEAMRSIIKEPSLLEEKLLQKAAKDLGLEMDRERQLYHGGRAIMTLLASMGHMCMSFDPPPQGGEEDEGCPTKSASTKQTATSSSIGSRTRVAPNSASTPSAKRGRHAKKASKKRRKKR
jgi:hypothetical protein